MMENNFGQFIRTLREDLNVQDKSYSLRQVAQRLDIEPSYLSKVERGIEAKPSEDLILKISQAYNQDSDVMLAMAGRVSKNLQEIIMKNPKVFAELLRSLKDMPDHAILRLVREVQDGEW